MLKFEELVVDDLQLLTMAKESFVNLLLNLKVDNEEQYNELMDGYDIEQLEMFLLEICNIRKFQSAGVYKTQLSVVICVEGKDAFDDDELLCKYTLVLDSSLEPIDDYYKVV